MGALPKLLDEFGINSNKVDQISTKTCQNRIVEERQKSKRKKTTREPGVHL